MQNQNQNQSEYKMIYSFRIKTLLEMEGFIPIFETENPKNKKYKCWVYKATPAFDRAFLAIAGKGEK